MGTAADTAKMIADFVPIARAVIGVKNLKIITFGPRPQDFFTCNAPIKGLYELGVEVEENSEASIRDTEAINAKVRTNQDKARAEAEAKECSDQYTGLTGGILLSAGGGTGGARFFDSQDIDALFMAEILLGYGLLRWG